jgi:hypothetical protein
MDSRRLASDLAHEMRRSRVLRLQAAAQITRARAARRRCRDSLEQLRRPKTDVAAVAAPERSR